MKTLTSLLLTVAISAFATAQTLTPSVLASSGGYFTGGGNSLSWTMGETFNKTLQSGNYMLTEGEQQPYTFLKLINLRAFIEGYYSGGSMQPVLYNTSLSANPNDCDSIQLNCMALLLLTQLYHPQKRCFIPMAMRKCVFQQPF